MIIQMHETDRDFGFELTPETVAEAALLVRFSLGATKDLLHKGTTAYRDGTFATWISIGRRKDASGEIAR